jgi:hypothetical protein
MGMRNWLRIAIFTTLLVVLSGWSFASEPVGQAVLIKTAVTGDTGELAVESPVYRDEHIRTSHSGLGQFVFRDGTKLAVGWGSSITIDEFVFSDTKTLKKLTINAAKGTFRWISGKSASSAYEIVTPAGTLGVRGTAFDFYVGQSGATAVVLLKGAARFCGAGGCEELTHRCDAVVATPNSKPTRARRADRSLLSSLGEPRALPFLTGNQSLSGDFQANDSACKLAKTALRVPDPQDPASREVNDKAESGDRHVKPTPTPTPDPPPPSPKHPKYTVYQGRSGKVIATCNTRSECLKVVRAHRGFGESIVNNRTGKEVNKPGRSDDKSNGANDQAEDDNGDDGNNGNGNNGNGNNGNGNNGNHGNGNNGNHGNGNNGNGNGQN